jgi:predicted nucleic acid-binding protein
MSGERVFADTSGFLALIDADDAHHKKASKAWKALGSLNAIVLTTDFVRLETCSLVQRRLGVAALLDFCDLILPVVDVRLVGADGFERAIGKWRLARRRQLSLVDVTSFDCMRGNGIQRAFAFDRHFVEEGFLIES